MARRVLLHVGTPKSGTTYLQSLWWHHRDALAERGLLLPGKEIGDHFHAASLVTERAEVTERFSEPQRGVWDGLLDQVAQWSGTALVSHELFARATAEQAAEALRRLGEVADEVHLLVTARDLVRQLPSAWQQRVKAGRTDPLPEFWRQVRDRDPSNSFWTFHDLPALLDRWGQGLSPDHVHLVVLARARAPRSLLWEQVCELTGTDPAGLDVEVERANESLGLVEVELMRRVHLGLPPERRGLDLGRLTSGFFTRKVLVPAGPGVPFVLPAEIHRWAAETGSAMAQELRNRDLHVVGDLADLEPAAEPDPGRTPESVTEKEVAGAAVASLSRMLLHELDRRDEMSALRADRRRLRRRLREGS